MANKHKHLLFALAILLLLLSAVLSLCLGTVSLSIAEIWNCLFSGPTDTAGIIFWYSRFPRTVACLLSGAALATAGCILQTVLGNPLASPHIIGVNAGAGLAVTACYAAGVLSGWLMAFASFGGAMAAAVLVFLLSQKTGASRTTVVLSGLAINSILNALSDVLIALVPDAAGLSSDFQIGDFSSIVSSRLLPAGSLILLALGVVMAFLQELDILALGEETALSLGMPVQRMRGLFLLLAALLAGASVSFAGLLGFVGLLVPHAMRALVGNNSHRMVPLSAFFGASFVTLCDLFSRLLFAPHELPVGILMSLIGGPFFLVLIFRKKGGRIP